MHNVRTGFALLGLVLWLGCASRTKTKTTYDESVKQHESVEQRGPEPPKIQADEMEHEYEAK
jgi:hypothetical protein